MNRKCEKCGQYIVFKIVPIGGQGCMVEKCGCGEKSYYLYAKKVKK